MVGHRPSKTAREALPQPQQPRLKVDPLLFHSVERSIQVPESKQCAGFTLGNLSWNPTEVPNIQR
ncbi:hypothetical protein BH09SUM1_BH09SUM1_16870 [soil metagenome]